MPWPERINNVVLPRKSITQSDKYISCCCFKEQQWEMLILYKQQLDTALILLILCHGAIISIRQWNEDCAKVSGFLLVSWAHSRQDIRSWILCQMPIKQHLLTSLFVPFSELHLSPEGFCWACSSRSAPLCFTFTPAAQHSHKERVTEEGDDENKVPC